MKIYQKVTKTLPKSVLQAALVYLPRGDKLWNLWYDGIGLRLKGH